MNEKNFDFMFESFCNFCSSLDKLSEADLLLLEGFRKSIRGWYSGYKHRVRLEMMLDE